MTKLAAITLLAINVAAVLGAVALLIHVRTRAMPDSLSNERIDIAAARLAAQPSQSAIAEILHRDESYIRALIGIGEAQNRLSASIVIGFMVISGINVLYVLPAVRKSNRNA